MVEKKYLIRMHKIIWSYWDNPEIPEFIAD